MQVESKSPEPKKMRVAQCAVNRVFARPPAEPRSPAGVSLNVSHRDTSQPSHKAYGAAGDCAQDDKLLRSTFPDGAFPLWRSRFASARGRTEPPGRAKYPKESTAERVLVLAKSQSAIH